MVKRTGTRFIARMIEGAKPSQMPGFISPQLATLKSKAPMGDKWLREIKYDGYRVQVHLNKGQGDHLYPWRPRLDQALCRHRPVVCTENLIRVDDIMESPKLAE
jgi:hypothetical protein